MSTSIPPLLPDEQLRLAREDVRRSNRRRRWLWFFLALSLIFNVIFWGMIKVQRRPVDPRTQSIFTERFISGDRDSKNKIALIRVDGIISSSSESHVGYEGMVGDIKEQLRVALDDESVKAIILRVDSPGGEVLASDEIYRAVKEASQKGGDEGKLVICSMGSLAASGGFYAAMGADYIIADELTITGSIGVIMQTLNYKDLFGKIGLKSIVFKSGKFKDILNGGREPTQEEMDLVQKLIMETYDKFVGIVAKERKLDENELRNEIADGRILSGKQALEAKLVDRTGNLDDAIEEAMNRENLEDARVVDYVVPFSLRNLFGFFAESRVQKIQLELPQTLDLQHGKLYFLSLHLF